MTTTVCLCSQQSQPPKSNASFSGEEVAQNAVVFTVFYAEPWHTIEPNIMVNGRVTFGANEPLVGKKDVETLLAHIIKTLEDDIRGLFAPLFR